MLYIKRSKTYGFCEAATGMRLSYRRQEPHSLEDLYHYVNAIGDPENHYTLSSDDFLLMMKLVQKSDSESKFMRFIVSYLTVEAPLYWWKQFDQYKIGCSTLSESTMHTITKRNLSVNDLSALTFAREPTNNKSDIGVNYLKLEKTVVAQINKMIDSFNKSHDPEEREMLFNAIIGILPSSYMQTRMITASYQTLRHIYRDRKDHKLNEWRLFCDFLEKYMPYSALITVERN